MRPSNPKTTMYSSQPHGTTFSKNFEFHSQRSNMYTPISHVASPCILQPAPRAILYTLQAFLALFPILSKSIVKNKTVSSLITNVAFHVDPPSRPQAHRVYPVAPDKKKSVCAKNDMKGRTNAILPSIVPLICLPSGYKPIVYTLYTFYPKKPFSKKRHFLGTCYHRPTHPFSTWQQPCIYSGVACSHPHHMVQWGKM